MFSQEFVDSFASAVASRVIAQMASQQGVQPRLLTTEQAAGYLGLPSASALRQRKCAGQVPDYCYAKMGGSVMYDRLGLDKWVEMMKSDN